MEHYKRVTKYWRDSLVDKQFSQGKYRPADLEKNFLPNRKDKYRRVNSKNLLQLLSSFEDPVTDVSYIPFSYKKVTRHTEHEKDYRPEIIFPIILKVQVSENGFIYPTEKPIIPRDLLLPLDKEDFSIGNMDDYDLFLTRNDIPSFGFMENAEWEKFYTANITPTYQKGLINRLLQESIIDNQEAQKDFKQLIKSLYKNTKFENVLSEYNNEWDQTIEEQLTHNPEFNKVIQSYASKWDEYVAYIDKLLKHITQSSDVLKVGYEKIHSAYFTNGEIDIASKITAVYEDIYTRDKTPGLRLFRNYTTVEQKSETPVISSTGFFSKRLGHNNNQHPLADAQRTAVSALLGAEHGEILPVNGPPGTGKTTMLLSVVACLWVKKAIEKAAPPVIIANSTNNQAVTNIIDAFAKDFSEGNGDFSGRWIDGINSFGSYFVSSMRSAEAKEKGYITEDVIKKMETQDFYDKAKLSFLKKSGKAFANNYITVKKSVERLHQLLMDKNQLLNNIEELYNNFHQTGKQISELFQIDYKNLSALTTLGEQLQDSQQEMKTIEDKWEKYLASENIFFAAFSFLPFVRKKRNLKAKIFAKENHFGKYISIDNPDVETLLPEIKNKQENISSQLQQYKSFQKIVTNYTEALHTLDKNINPDAELIEIDKKADTAIRFEMFLIATHYWEGKWLLEMEELIAKGQLGNIKNSFKERRESNWLRRMKITPCAVMTSYMLPGYFSFSREIHDKIYKTDYLYDFIDLLIVDEAGQVPPEVAGAGFSLAKKALVIGDTKQIPPISKLTKSIDIGNLHKADLLSKNEPIHEIDQAYKNLQHKGIAADGGSVMKISQNRTPYYPEKQLERGLYLYEHRRCYDNIIAFCNELCYKGVLKPMRGKPEKQGLLPSMGYLHIDGKCQNFSGSKQNELEAKVIAGWIVSNYDRLREAYNGEEIKDIVAVVTPFREQARKITEFLKNSKARKISKELAQITVGTVHSLQGAERKVVLFSPTYSKHNKGSFIDNDKSMLNVAVSRAKDSFLVFGDMSLFDRESTSPTGILAKYLFEEETNQLIYEHQYSTAFIREDLITKEHSARILTNHEEHDAFLKEIISQATQRIVIISPWLLYHRIEQNGYDKLLSGKKEKITIYTDKKFNTYTQNNPDSKKEKQFTVTLNKLKELGIETILKNNIHSKIVIKDNDTICIGSFNWFSARREGPYENMEHSIVYQSENVKDEIENILQHLDTPAFSMNK